MALPSPIPHPRSTFDAGRAEAIERVVGSDWPEADERAMRGLSDQWLEAAKLVGPLLEDAGRAVSGAVTAFGGADTRQGEALQRLWDKTGGSLGAGAFEELGRLAAAGARIIEAAKLEIYVLVAQMLADLETLDAVSSTTLGVAAAGAEPVIVATRRAVTGVLDKAINELNELGSRAAAHTGLGQFSFGVPMLAEQLTTTTEAAVGATGGTGAPQPVDGGDLVMAYGVGSFGAATGVAAMSGAGGSRGTALRGRYGERAVRGGRAAEVLSAVTVNVITSDPAKWPGELPRMADVPPILRQASPEATAALSSLDNPRAASSVSAGVASVSAGLASAGSVPAGLAAAGPASVGMPSAGLASAPVGPVSAELASAVAAESAPKSGAPVAQTGPLSSSSAPLANPASAAPPAATAVAAGAAAGVTHATRAAAVPPVATPAVAGAAPRPEAVSTAGAGSAPKTEPQRISKLNDAAVSPASDDVAIAAFAQPGVGVQPGVTAPAAIGDTQRPGGTVASATRAATASGTSSFTLSALTQTPSTPAAPTQTPSAPASPQATSPPAPSGTPGLSQTASAQASSQTPSAPAPPQVASAQAPSQVAGPPAPPQTPSAPGLSQTPSAPDLSQTASAPAPEQEPPPPEPFLLLMQAQAAAAAATPKATTPTATSPQSSAGTKDNSAPTAEDYESLIANAVSGRPAKPGWARRELPPVHQQALAASGPEQFGDLRGDWVRLIDAGGPAADPARATISMTVAESVLDTWLRGRVRVAATDTAKKEIDDRLQRLRPDEQGLARVEAALRIEGHGSCAIIVQERTHGERHATTIHNRHGELFYVDAQRKSAPVAALPPPVKGVVRLDALAWRADDSPIDLARAEGLKPAEGIKSAE